MLDAERNTRALPRTFVKFESLLHSPRQCVESAFDCAGLAPPTAQMTTEELSDSSIAICATTIFQYELEARCPKLIVDYYQLLCKIADQGTVTREDQQLLEGIHSEFGANQSLFYNEDVLHSVSRGDQNPLFLRVRSQAQKNGE
ncbi:MAG: hypothetical protein R3E50_00540 [Halioglobus sp.]